MLPEAHCLGVGGCDLLKLWLRIWWSRVMKGLLAVAEPSVAESLQDFPSVLGPTK